MVHRHMHTASRISRDVLARYALPSGWPPSLVEATKNTYDTSATTPVSSSVQYVPDPIKVKTGKDIPRTSTAMIAELAQTATEVPAMKPTSAQSFKVDAPQRTEPIQVAGVWIPIKPRPPGEEGELDSIFLAGSNGLLNVYRLL
jgi:hypothetical protein